MAIAVYPFIIATTKEKENNILMNHEKIHLRQQRELLIIPFFILYYLHTLWNIIRYFDIQKAYKLNVFEVEAYTYEKSVKYLLYRKNFQAFVDVDFADILDKDRHQSVIKSRYSTISDRIAAGVLLLFVVLFIGIIFLTIGII